MNKRNWPARGALVIFGLAAAAREAAACATCFGNSDSALAQGMNFGILSLLVIVLGVLAGLVAFFILLGRRAAAAARVDAAVQSAAINAAVATCGFIPSVSGKEASDHDLVESHEYAARSGESLGGAASGRED